jgi:hypothetical protein
MFKTFYIKYVLVGKRVCYGVVMKYMVKYVPLYKRVFIENLKIGEGPLRSSWRIMFGNELL